MNIFKTLNLETEVLQSGVQMKIEGDHVAVVGESLKILIPQTYRFNEIARGVCVTRDGDIYLMKNDPLWYFLAGGGRYENGDTSAEEVLRREIAEEIGSNIEILSIGHLTDYLEVREQVGKQTWMRLTHAFVVQIDDNDLGFQNHDEGELERKTEVIKSPYSRARELLNIIYSGIFASHFVKAIEPALVNMAMESL